MCDSSLKLADYPLALLQLATHIDEMTYTVSSGTLNSSIPYHFTHCPGSPDSWKNSLLLFFISLHLLMGFVLLIVLAVACDWFKAACSFG